MNCLDCNAKIKLKKIKSTHGHCHGCGHEIVAMPKEDGISDRQIAKLLRKLATEEKLPVFPEHLAYTLAARPVSQAQSIACGVAGAVIASVLIGFEFWLLPVLALVAWCAWLLQKPRFGRYGRALELAQRFANVNPTFLAGTREIPHTQLDETLGARCTRVLIVGNARFASYLHEAQFPLKHACPVLGPELAELSLYPLLEERFRSDFSLKILLVTDFTPAGLAFSQKMADLIPGRTDIEHIGMDREFVNELESAARPLNEFPGYQARSAKTLGGGGAELFVLAPALMTAALAVALTSMTLVAPKNDEEEDWADLYYEDDSE